MFLVFHFILTSIRNISLVQIFRDSVNLDIFFIRRVHYKRFLCSATEEKHCVSIFFFTRLCYAYSAVLNSDIFPEIPEFSSVHAYSTKPNDNQKRKNGRSFLKLSSIVIYFMF